MASTLKSEQNIDFLLSIMSKRLAGRFDIDLSEVVEEVGRIRADLSCTWKLKSGKRKGQECSRLMCNQHGLLDDLKETKRDEDTYSHPSSPNVIDLIESSDESSDESSEPDFEEKYRTPSRNLRIRIPGAPRKRKTVRKAWLEKREEQEKREEAELTRALKESAMEANVNEARQKLGYSSLGTLQVECCDCDHPAVLKLSDGGLACG